MLLRYAPTVLFFNVSCKPNASTTVQFCIFTYSCTRSIRIDFFILSNHSGNMSLTMIFQTQRLFEFFMR